MPLPLHVFEPRYRKLVADVLDSHRMIGMSLLKPGFEADYEGRPPVFEIGCAGSLERCEATEDGRFEIVLQGRTRFRILEEHPGEPYRLASVEELPEPDRGDDPAFDAARSRVLEALGHLADGSAVVVLQNDLPHEVFVNALCQSLPLGPLELQALLDAPGALARYENLAELLEFRRFERGAGRPGPIH